MYVVVLVEEASTTAAAAEESALSPQPTSDQTKPELLPATIRATRFSSRGGDAAESVYGLEEEEE